MAGRRQQAFRAAAVAVMVAVTTVSCSAQDTGSEAPGATPVATNRVLGTGTVTPAMGSDDQPAGKSAKAADPSPGCGRSTVKAVELERRTLPVDGEERWYLLTTPGAHDGAKPLPLVLDLHGLSEGAQVHTMNSEFSPLAQKEGFVVAFPNGSSITPGPVRWDQRIDANPNHDLNYLDALLDKLGTDLCLDRSRVYVTGLSYGAIMTSTLLCARADRFAAAAPVDGIQMPPGCTPKRRVPILTFHGTADPILKFDGKVGSIPGISGGDDPPGATTTTAAPPVDLNGPGYPTYVAEWAKKNGCQTTPKDTKIAKAEHSGKNEGNDEVIHRVYDCPDGADTEFYIVVGGGHSWPGSSFSAGNAPLSKLVGATTVRLHASAEAWAFFQRFSLP